MVLAPNTPALRVFFPGVTVDPFRVEGATLIQQQLAHDVLRVRVSTGPSYAALSEGAPVSFTWSNANGAGGFWGYVHRIDPAYRNSGGTSQIICVGASYPLMATGVDVWTNARVSDVVRDIARRFRFAVDIEEHPLVLNQVSQAGESYWQLLCRLANKIGYVVRVEGATVIFRSHESLAHHFRPMATPLTYSRDPLSIASIKSFVPQVGAFNPENAAAQTSDISGIDPVTGLVISASESIDDLRARPSLRQGFLVGQVATSAAEAAAVSRGAQENSRLSQRAKMECVGYPSLQPGRFVSVLGVAPELAGNWMVRRIEHEMSRSSYMCTADLGTDGLGAAQLRAGESALKPGEVNPHRPGALPDIQNPTLVDHRSIRGSAGTPLQDVYWSSSVVDWS
jgi:hypothetical protein